MKTVLALLGLSLIIISGCGGRTIAPTTTSQTFDALGNIVSSTVTEDGFAAMSREQQEAVRACYAGLAKSQTAPVIMPDMKGWSPTMIMAYTMNQQSMQTIGMVVDALATKGDPCAPGTNAFDTMIAENKEKNKTIRNYGGKLLTGALGIITADVIKDANGQSGGNTILSGASSIGSPPSTVNNTTSTTTTNSGLTE